MKKCKTCKSEFVQYNTLQTICIECAIEKGRKKTVKDTKTALQSKKRELIRGKMANKPVSYFEAKAQDAINKWIVKVRDKDLPCISCGTTKQNIQYAAGHYRTRKAASQLRFNEDNIHKQCNSYCNRNLSGNIINYRPALIAKIGQERYEALMNNHEMKRWTKEECQEIERIYKKKLKDFKE